MKSQRSTIVETRDDGQDVERDIVPVVNVGEKAMGEDIEMDQNNTQNDNLEKTESIQKSNPIRLQILFFSSIIWVLLIVAIFIYSHFIIYVCVASAGMIYIIAANNNSINVYLEHLLPFPDVVEKFGQVRNRKPVITLKCVCYHTTGG